MLDPVATLEQARAMGNVNRLKLGPLEPVLVHHPECADHILRSSRHNYPKEGPFWEELSALMGQGLGTTEGERWLRLRRMMQPQFHRRKLASLFSGLLDSVQESMQWEDIGRDWVEIDIGERMPHLALNAASGALLGIPTSHETTKRITDDVGYVMSHVFRAMMAGRLPRWVPVPGHTRFMRTTARLRRMVLDIIEERRVHPREVDDLLGLLIEATDDDGEQMTDTQLLDQTISLFLAAYETTTTSLKWALAHLSEEPEHFGRLREEVDALGGQPPGVECLERLPYARWILQESLRLHPPAWWLPRQAREDDEVGGYEIPAGTLIAPVLYTIQRHPDFWPDPGRFDPERFEPSRVAGRHSLAWMPFGAGPHKCIGQGLSLMESTIVLVLLVQRYEIESVGHQVRPHIWTVHHPANGVRLRIRRRSAARSKTKAGLDVAAHSELASA